MEQTTEYIAAFNMLPAGLDDLYPAGLDGVGTSAGPYSASYSTGYVSWTDGTHGTSVSRYRSRAMERAGLMPSWEPRRLDPLGGVQELHIILQLAISYKSCSPPPTALLFGQARKKNHSTGKLEVVQQTWIQSRTAVCSTTEALITPTNDAISCG